MGEDTGSCNTGFKPSTGAGYIYTELYFYVKKKTIFFFCF